MPVQFQCWHGQVLEDTEAYYEEEFRELSEAYNGVPQDRAMYHGFKRAGGEAAAGERMFAGEKRLLAVEEALEIGLKWVRHVFQRQFHNICLQSVAKLVVGDDWPMCGERICRERGWDSTDVQICAAAAARRFGKSISVACLAAVLAIYGPPGLLQGIFSTGQRASGYLGNLVYTTLVESGYGHMIVRHNQEELWIVPDANRPTDVRKLFYYPANPDIRLSAARARARIPGPRSPARARACVRARAGDGVRATTVGRGVSFLPLRRRRLYPRACARARVHERGGAQAGAPRAARAARARARRRGC